MVIDIIVLAVLVLAIIQGIRRGLIVALFSFLALFIGVAAAMKLSVVASQWFAAHTSINERWIPFLSFAAVMIAVMLLVKWVAALIQTAVESLMLGWINKIGGIVLYAVLNITLLSVALFYLVQMHIVKPEALAASHLYPVIQPVGPVAINAFARLFPLFKDMFTMLEHFFENIARQAGQ